MGNKRAKVLTLLNGKFNILSLSTYLLSMQNKKCHKVNMCLKVCSIHKEGVKIWVVLLSSAPINTEQPVCVKTPCNTNTFSLFKLKVYRS